MVDSLDPPNLVITIPHEFSSDFFGILVLDILHDSVKYAVLHGNRLSQITDLIAVSFLHYNEGLDVNYLQDWVFINVLKYFVKLWRGNLQNGLGLRSENDLITVDISVLREIIKIPVYKVNSRKDKDEDKFVSTKTIYSTVEYQNYNHQKDELFRENHNVNYESFSSPEGVTKPLDFFRKQETIVNNICSLTNGKSRIVLDMKASAGLIRSICDPITYITGLPTFADPGCNMPGMSAIRAFSENAFTTTTTTTANNLHFGSYKHIPSFKYQIEMEYIYNGEKISLLFFNANYFYGSNKNGMSRENLMIDILGEKFHGFSPRSWMMAEALGNYLNPVETEISETFGQVLSIYNSLIADYYTNVDSENQQGYNINKQLKDWAVNCPYKQAYLNTVYKNSQMFPEIDRQLDESDLHPEKLIGEILPEIMQQYLESGDQALLAFCYRQYVILRDFIGMDREYTPREFNFKLSQLLKRQYIDGRKKLTTQIEKAMELKKRRDTVIYQRCEEWIYNYLKKIILVSRQNLSTILQIIFNETENESGKFDILNTLPEFNPPNELYELLHENIYFFYPFSTSVIEEGKLIYSLLDTILQKNSPIKIPIDLQMKITQQYLENDETITFTALTKVLGKFSGDFGQIVWSINNGHIFATEDNNASAMALFLHRLPREYMLHLNGGHKIWGNLHGVGNGGHVDTFIEIF